MAAKHTQNMRKFLSHRSSRHSKRNSSTTEAVKAIRNASEPKKQGVASGLFVNVSVNWKMVPWSSRNAYSCPNIVYEEKSVPPPSKSTCTKRSFCSAPIDVSACILKAYTRPTALQWIDCLAERRPSSWDFENHFAARSESKSGHALQDRRKI